MDIPLEHIPHLKRLGLTEEDLRHFDGEWVSYEYDPARGVRLFDPYYKTSYREFVDVDGWSSWSTEKDTFMSDLLQGTRAEVKRMEGMREKPSPQEIASELQKRLGKKGS